MSLAAPAGGGPKRPIRRSRAAAPTVGTGQDLPAPPPPSTDVQEPGIQGQKRPIRRRGGGGGGGGGGGSQGPPAAVVAAAGSDPFEQATKPYQLPAWLSAAPMLSAATLAADQQDDADEPPLPHLMSLAARGPAARSTSPPSPARATSPAPRAPPSPEQTPTSLPLDRRVVRPLTHRFVSIFVSATASATDSLLPNWPDVLRIRLPGPGGQPVQRGGGGAAVGDPGQGAVRLRPHRENSTCGSPCIAPFCVGLGSFSGLIGDRGCFQDQIAAEFNGPLLNLTAGMTLEVTNDRNPGRSATQRHPTPPNATQGPPWGLPRCFVVPLCKPLQGEVSRVESVQCYWNGSLHPTRGQCIFLF